jgi:hypothetical protein
MVKENMSEERKETLVKDNLFSINYLKNEIMQLMNNCGTSSSYFACDIKQMNERLNELVKTVKQLMNNAQDLQDPNCYDKEPILKGLNNLLGTDIKNRFRSESNGK